MKRPTVLDPHPDIAALPFEKAMQELEDIVGRLEKGAVSLDESVKLYERGKALQARCETLLREAEARVEKITLGENGQPKGVAPLDVE
jgi:exodeoxyribonuclease VII small subunit